MKAVVITGRDGLDALDFLDVPVPELQEGQVLIRVRACALNYLDLLLRNLRLGVALPHISGSDVAGEVVEVRGRSRLKPGDAVVVNPSFPCGTCVDCLGGRPCDEVKIFGYNTPGGFAEYVAVPAAQVYPKPSSLSFAEAAAFPMTFLTAWHMLSSRAAIQKGETVFVWGASGGSGSAGVQVAKHFGARVIAAAKSPADARRIKAMGADEVVIRTHKNVVEQVKQLSGGGVDIVYEMVGAKTWAATLAMLRPHSRVVIAGTASGEVVSQDLSDIYYRQLTILGSRMGTRDDFEAMLKQVDAGRLKPVIDKIFPLKSFRQAEKRLEEGKHVGKIVLEL